MQVKRYVCFLAGVGLLFGLIPALVSAAPNTQEGPNLLTNPGFEGDWHWQGDSFLGKIADGWVAWWVDDAAGKSGNDPTFWKNQRPEYGLAGLEYNVPDQVRSGSKALQYGKRYATHTSGVYQQVSGVTPGSRLRFSAWGFVFGKDPDSSRSPGNVGMKVGIDPTGGTNLFSGSVVWSSTVSPVATGSGSAWMEMSIEVEAQNSAVTVFVYSTQSQPMDTALTSQWDDTKLVVVAAAEEPTAPPPPAPSNPGPPPPPAATATPSPDGSIIHTVQSGETLWAIAIQYATGSSLTAEQMLSQINQLNSSPALIYSGQHLVIAVPQNQQPAAVSSSGEGVESAPAAAEGENLDSAPQPTAAVAAASVEQPAAPNSGSICVSAYHDRNGDGARDVSTEEPLAETGFTLSNESGVVASYTSDNTTESYCFSQLIAGNYMLLLTKPAGYNTTTPEYWAVSLQDGDTINVSFGNQADPNASVLGEQPKDKASDPLTNLLSSTGGNDADSQGSSSSESKSLLAKLGEIAIGISGVFVFLLAVAVAVAFFASRRRRT